MFFCFQRTQSFRHDDHRCANIKKGATPRCKARSKQALGLALMVALTQCLFSTQMLGQAWVQQQRGSHFQQKQVPTVVLSKRATALQMTCARAGAAYVQQLLHSCHHVRMQCHCAHRP